MDALALLRGYLEKPPFRKDKAPAGLDRQLKATSERAAPDVWVALLEGGFQSWYAYFVARPEIRETVDELPPGQLRNVAKELGEIVPHKDVQELFQHLFDVADRADSRCRKLGTLGTLKRRLD